ncbi:MAG TPA: DNA primase [Actinomycetota bacterium]|nr:DNA primase [Actinomycetota bacterium]
MAKIREDDIDALRERADIVEVVSAHSQLKRAGAHTFKGLCPFHSEKTPSFQVDAAKGLWHCFGCGEGGNVYHFVQKTENLPFPEAVEWLARRFAFDLHYEEARPGEHAAARGVKARIVEANDAAARFFNHQLFTSPEAGAARTYLESRGFGREVAERWVLGYAPGRNALARHLLSRGFKQEEIVQADLARVSDRDGSLYDTFRQRITFPTWNLQGDVVGFGARALGDQQPKYLNTSETPVFSKSRVMYGLNRAKSAIARAAALVVEGYTDVIALHEAGVQEAVATNGVALGDTHFEQLKKFSSRAILMFDADAAGAGATERGFGIHHRIGMEVLVAPLPPGRDPADMVKSDGEEGIRKVIDAAVPLLEFKLEQTLAKAALDTPEARSHAVRQACEVLGWHPDPIARHEYAFMAARRIGVDPEVVHRALDEERSRPPGQRGTDSDAARDRRFPGHVKVEREALQLLLLRTQEAGPWATQVEPTHFTSAARRELFTQGLAWVERGDVLDERAFAQQLSPEALSLFTELTVGADVPQPDELDERLREVFVRLQVFALERDIKARRNTLQEINPLDDPQRHDQLFTELVGLEAERRDLLRKVLGDG